MEYLSLLIPILGISIPLAAVVGLVIVKPFVQVLDRLVERLPAGRASADIDARLARMENEMAEVRRVFNRMLEEQEFQNQLRVGARGEVVDPERVSPDFRRMPSVRPPDPV